jgi:hypothetical protein
VVGTTVVGNDATGDAVTQASKLGGGIFATSRLMITDSTISTNDAVDGGSGIYHPTGHLVLTGITVVGNTGAYSVGIVGLLSGQVFPVTLERTIVHPGSGVACSPSPNPPRSLGWNLIGDDSCRLTADPTDQQNTDPLLGPLADNGGPTQTHLPLPGSRAIDAGGVCTGVDQRGVVRPQGAACDVGAVEQAA